jgi:hypothetical protein
MDMKAMRLMKSEKNRPHEIQEKLRKTSGS